MRRGNGLLVKIANADFRDERLEMSYHHSQRVIAHLNPIQEAAQANSTGRLRHNKLTGSTQLVLAHIASAINNETGSFPVSIATIYKRTRLSKSTIQLALQQLCDFGVLERERNYYRQAFTYSLRLQCPDDCKNLKEHNTPKELSERPTPQDDYGRGDRYDTDKKQRPIPQADERPIPQADESPTPQVDSVLANRSLIKIDKQTNKNVDKHTQQHCLSCYGTYEPMGDGKFLIHKENCKELGRLRESQPWIIAANKVGARWQQLDYRQQQFHYWEDLSAYKNSQLEKTRQVERENDFITQKAIELIPEGTLPNWSTWLTLTYKQRKEIPDQHKNLAISKSRDGFDLIPGRPWEKGAYPQEPLEDWGEDDELF